MRVKPKTVLSVYLHVGAIRDYLDAGTYQADY